MATSIFLEFLKTLAALWLTLAFAGGLFFVWQSYRAVFGQVAHDSRWGQIICMWASAHRPSASDGHART